MKTALIYAGTLLAFLLMAIDPYLATWLCIIYAVIATAYEYGRRRGVRR